MSRPQKYHVPLTTGFNEALLAIADESKPSLINITARPFLKWVGGKRSILPELIARMPKEYTVYNEPFLGGGALFFVVQPKQAYLSDINFHLIVTFQAVKDDVQNVIDYLKIHASRHNKTYYYEARAKLSKETDSAQIAALFIYINKTCFNGLYRVNKQGQFNVPIGDYKNPNIVDEGNLLAVSKALKNTDIFQKDFSQIQPQKDNFYYIDPPYHGAYDGYNGGGFGDKEHTNLASFCREIDKIGGYFMVSNSDTELVRTLYKGYTIEEVSALRSVSCKAHQRQRENELIIRNYK